MDQSPRESELEKLPWEHEETAVAAPIRQMNLVPQASMDLQTQIDNAGKFMELQSKIRMLAVKLTNCHDWEDQKGIPYLKWQGAAKIRSAFQVSYTTPIITRENCRDEDGPYVIYHAEAMVSWQGASIPCVGTGSTRDPFFGKKNGHEIPLSEIDLTDIKKKACTNMLNRGLRDLLGLTYTWEEIDQIVGGGIKEGARRQDYNGPDKPAAAPAPAAKAPAPPATQPLAPLPQNFGGDIHTPAPEMAPAWVMDASFPAEPPAPAQREIFPAPAKPEHAQPPKADGATHSADQVREMVWSQLVEICGPDHAASKLEELTGFQGDRGWVNGKREMRLLTDKQAYRLVKIVGDEHKRFKTAFG